MQKAPQRGTNFIGVQQAHCARPPPPWRPQVPDHTQRVAKASAHQRLIARKRAEPKQAGGGVRRRCARKPGRAVKVPNHTPAYQLYNIIRI
jgi:hypothetical protein